ncbi:hypothetical protein GCM10010112_46420 [Actinoplanes lobatus]|nr:hypothetical protein GCM10010112_46420 [Actinoplanes lobatus]
MQGGDAGRADQIVEVRADREFELFDQVEQGWAGRHGGFLSQVPPDYPIDRKPDRHQNSRSTGILLIVRALMFVRG